MNIDKQNTGAAREAARKKLELTVVLTAATFLPLEM